MRAFDTADQAAGSAIAMIEDGERLSRLWRYVFAQLLDDYTSALHHQGVQAAARMWASAPRTTGTRTCPAWCWLTQAGMTACGLRYPPRPPALSRLTHIRAVLAARLWLEAGQAYGDGQAWWRSERSAPRCRPMRARCNIADAEICWQSTGGPHGGQTWAIEVKLTPQPAARTADHDWAAVPPGYAQVVYLASPASRPVVARAAAGLPAGWQAKVAVRDLPPHACLPGALR